jgi:hypothetical protein
MYQITTGVQTVSATGPVTGTLNTSSLSGNFTVRVTINGLPEGLRMMLSLEDTSSSTPFSDARTVAHWDTYGGMPADGLTLAIRSDRMPSAKFGAANTALRVNCTALDEGATAQVVAWLEQ